MAPTPITASPPATVTALIRNPYSDSRAVSRRRASIASVAAPEKRRSSCGSRAKPLTRRIVEKLSYSRSTMRDSSSRIRSFPVDIRRVCSRIARYSSGAIDIATSASAASKLASTENMTASVRAENAIGNRPFNSNCSTHVASASRRYTVSPRGVRSWCASERLWRCEKSRARSVYTIACPMRTCRRVWSISTAWCASCVTSPNTRMASERLHAGVGRHGEKPRLQPHRQRIVPDDGVDDGLERPWRERAQAHLGQRERSKGGNAARVRTHQAEGPAEGRRVGRIRRVAAWGSGPAGQVSTAIEAQRLRLIRCGFRRAMRANRAETREMESAF